MKVAVVGGGIAGLAAAWELRGRTEVTVFEPAALGGKLRTSMFDGRPVDEGPDAFITRTGGALDLCAELGVTADLVSPAAGRTLLWSRGRLHPLPDDLVLGVPKRLGALARGGLLSPMGVGRAAADLFLPRSPIGDDISVRQLVERRFGVQVATRLVEPLVGGIHAARIDELSAAATVPQLLSAARRSRSLVRALRAQPAASGGLPLFLTPREGLGSLVATLVGRLQHDGVTIRTERVDTVDADSQGRWRVGAIAAGEGGRRRVDDVGAFDAVVLATAAPEAARILGAGAPVALAELQDTSVTVITLAFAAADLDVPAGVNGALVPPGEGRLITACSFGSNKWPHWSGPDRVVVRASVGRHGDDRSSHLDDEAMVERVVGEVNEALAGTASPTATRVSRWPRSLPFYRVGHLDRLAGITAALGRSQPGVALAGCSYDGAGIPACITSGRQAARQLLSA